MHRRGEPFDYSRRAAEILRHRFVCLAVRRLDPNPARLLDIGCSMGQLTAQLARLPQALFAVDLSPTAIRGARQRLRALGRPAHCVVASATALPFRAGTFDVVVLSDGLHSWQLPAEERRLALDQAHRVVRPGGHALLTEYLQPSRSLSDRSVRVPSSSSRSTTSTIACGISSSHGSRRCATGAGFGVCSVAWRLRCCCAPSPGRLGPEGRAISASWHADRCKGRPTRR